MRGAHNAYMREDYKVKKGECNLDKKKGQPIIAYKGFDENLQCRGFRYEIGKAYEMDGDINACERGFHACEQPLDVFIHYPPSTSRFCRVEQSGKLSRGIGNSSIASSRIKVVKEIGIHDLVSAQIEYVKRHVKTSVRDKSAVTAGEYGAATAGRRGVATAGCRGAATSGDGGTATAGDYGAATAGYRGAASAGYKGAASAEDWGAATAGYKGASTAGDFGAASAGYLGAATAGRRGVATAGDLGAATSGAWGAATAGVWGAATVGDCGYALSGWKSSCGKNGVAVARGRRPFAKGGDGAVLVLAKTDYDANLIELKSFFVDGTEIKPDTWYTIDNGQAVAVGDVWGTTIGR